jgi:hypothetical protein
VGSKSIRVGLYYLARSQFLNTCEHAVGIRGDVESSESVGFNNTAGMASWCNGPVPPHRYPSDT